MHGGKEHPQGFQVFCNALNQIFYLDALSCQSFGMFEGLGVFFL
jgi:hypothetical protein